ncbi:hypothetical protein HZP84_04295 [Elizabethkingia anophelis]|uniref:Uncharacterized protein n=2 Tax=Elizabethkingia anophelis TaxID=1117645 RepID=A0A494J9P8_9FLAO|nr:hypothetical protein [Elizabethkingia anophelis]AQX51585.1 hypothetical protein AYC66_13245 [Elizabethkingia anophelis]ELB0067145.1 hypothetical protein [Elizabethkingia anophelis]ELB1891839.1 hypothetical protein [Elizabethkingia anophelis]MCT3630707.1 hypothetical protein [Elizabethkingia anophelis]MCT3634389.1 hypothetical protein [Elizabethkingia anophelis]
MLSSADLHMERALIIAALGLFFGAGFSYTLIAFIINSVRRKNKKTLYYVLSFLISGIIVVVLAALYFYNILIEHPEPRSGY